MPKTPKFFLNIISWIKKKAKRVKDFFISVYHGIPGTKYYEWNIRKRVFEKTKERILLFKTLFNESEKFPAQYVQFYEYQKRVSRLQIIESRTINAIKIFLLISLLPLFFSFTILAFNKDSLFFGLFLFGIVLALLPQYLLIKTVKIDSTFKSIIFIFITFVEIYFLSRIFRNSLFPPTYLSSFTMSVFLLSLSIFLLFTIFGDMYIHYQQVQKMPLATITNSLISSIALMDSEIFNLSTPENKQEIIFELDLVANAVRKGFSKSLSFPDSISSNWFKHSCEEVSSYIDSLKKWVATPYNDTEKHLNQELRTLLHLFISGSWGDLPRMDPVKPTIKSVLKRIGAALQTITIGCIPLGFYLLLPATNLPFDRTPELTLFVGVFAALSLIIAIKPDSMTQISDMSSIIPFFRFPGKKD